MESEGEGESQDPQRPLSSSDGTSSLWDGAESARDRRGMCAGRRTLRQSRLTTSRLAEDAAACRAEDDGLRVREDGRDGEATCVSKSHMSKVIA